MYEMLGNISKTKKPVYKQGGYIYAEGGALHKFVAGGDPGDITCPKGYEYNYQTKYCELINKTKCPDNFTFDEKSGRCISNYQKEKIKVMSAAYKYDKEGNKLMFPTDYDDSEFSPVSDDQLDYNKSSWPKDYTIKGIVNPIYFEDHGSILVSSPDYVPKYPGDSQSHIETYPDLNYKVVVDSKKPEGYNKDESIYYVKSENTHQFKKYKEWEKLKKLEKDNIENAKKFGLVMTEDESPNSIKLYKHPQEHYKVLKEAYDDEGNDVSSYWDSETYDFKPGMKDVYENEMQSLQEHYNDPEYLGHQVYNKSFDETFKDRGTKNIERYKVMCPHCRYYHGQRMTVDPDYIYDTQSPNQNPIDEDRFTKPFYELEYDYTDPLGHQVMPTMEEYEGPEAPHYEPLMSYNKRFVKTGRKNISLDRFIGGTKFGRGFTVPIYGIIDDKIYDPKASQWVNKQFRKDRKIQKETGYDRSYYEGSYDEEGNYIPGEIENAERENRRVNFDHGQMGRKDRKAQEHYNLEYEAYELEKKRIDDLNNAERQQWLPEQEIISHAKGGLVNLYQNGNLHKFVDGGLTDCRQGYYWNGTKCVKGTPPTFADSLAIYNNALVQKEYYDKLKKYFKPVIIKNDKGYNTEIRDNIKEIEKAHLEYDTKYTSWTDQEKAKFKNLKNKIKSNTNPNVSYITDVITGMLDPNAPPLRYDSRINNQGSASYHPNTKDYTNRELDIIKKADSDRSYIETITYYTNTSRPDLGGSKEKWLNFAKKNRISKKEMTGLLYKIKHNVGISENLKGWQTLIPYYDPLAVKPDKLLNDSEIRLRYEKYGKSGISESRLKKLGLLKDDSKNTQTFIKSNLIKNTDVSNVPEKIENLPILKPSLIQQQNYQLQGNTINKKNLNLPNEEVESEYLEPGSPDTENAMEWVDKRKYNIDWNGIQIPYRLPRFRKPGHYGDLIKPGKKRYINLPTIESRNTAYLREEQDGGLHKFVGGGEHCPKGEYWNGTNCVPGINPESDWFKLTDAQKRLLEKGNNLATVEDWYKQSPEQMEMFKSWIDEHDAETYLNQLDPESDQSKRFNEALGNDREWNKEWYTKRKTLHQFKDVAERRLAIKNQDMVSSLKDPVNLSMDWWRTHPSKFSNIPEVFYAPEIGAITRDNIADYNTDPQGYVEDSYYIDANDKLQNSTITHEESHIRDHFAPQKNTTDHIKKSEWTQPVILDPLQKIITAEEALSDPRNNGYAGTYQQQPTEFRARLNVWRKKNGIDPLKNYTEEELKSIIDTNLQDPNLDHQIKELYETIKSDPSKLKFVHDSYVSNDSNKDLDTAKHGGLHKFVTGGASSCPIGEYWNGTKCVPNYGVNPLGQLAVNNFLNNTVSGVNAKIAETQRKGMAYQSTADELKVLNKQKEKLKADEAKRIALENQEKIRQQQLRTVGSDNTRVDNSIIKNNNGNYQLPYEQALTITKAQKDAARDIVNSGDFGNYFPEQMDYYLSKDNSYRQDGPLTLEELALKQIRTNPNFFQSLEEKRYQDFLKREQKTYDEMPWYMKGINTVNALASDPITTLERGLLEFKRPLAFQGLQSTDPSGYREDARFYDRALNRDENVLNNTLNYINPFRAASSAGQNLQQGDYGDAAVDFATILPMLKGAKAGWKGFTGLNNALNKGINTGLTNAGASSLVQGAKAGWRAPLPLGKTITNATAGALTPGAALGLGFGIHGALNAPEDLNRFIANPNLDTGVDLGISTLEMLTSPGVGNAMKFGVKGAKDLAKFFSTDSKAASITDDIALDLESQIAKLKQQQVLTEQSVQVLASDYKAGKISAEEYKSLYKELDPNKLLNSKVELETILREHKIKQDIVNTPQQNILKSEKQLGKNISEAGISNKGVFEVGDKYVARLSAHGYDDASILVKYADKIKSPRIAKTLQVKELNGNVYQVQEKVTGTPVEKLTEIELQNIPKEHIDNFLKDKAELEELGLYIDFDNANSNMLYDSKKGFQFIDLGISPVGKNMMESNELFAQTYKGLNLPGSPNSFSPTSINAADTGSPLNRFLEIKDLSKAEADALKLANPQMKTKLIKEAKIKGTTLPERFPLTIEGQQQAFDDATDFALNWGLKDADAYNTIHSDFVVKSKRHDDLTNEILQYTSSAKYKEIAQKYKDINDAIITEFLSINNINKNDLINYQVDEILYHQERIAEILAENSERSIDLQRGEAYRKKINELQSEEVQLAHDMQLLHNSKQSLIDPTFKEKVQNLYREAGAAENQIPQNAFYGDKGYGIRDFGKDRIKLVEMNQFNPLSEPSFAELSDADQMTLANDWEKMLGVRTKDATITLQSKINDYYYTERTTPKTTYTTRYEPAKNLHPLKPWTWQNYNSVGKNVREVNREPYTDEPILIERLEKIRENPTELAGVNAHEIGHDYQKFFQNWSRLLTEYDPKKAYQSSHSKNKLAKRFQDAMVKGKNLTKDELKKGDHKTETWYSSPNELHSELMKARYNVYNKYKAEQPEMSQKDIINWIKKSEASGDDNIFDLYIYALNKHFKPETTNAERKALIKLLPVLIPAAGLGVMEGMNNEKPQNKYGGNIKTLSKFIKK